MNQEIFHLYGMRIMVLGDTFKARDLAGQARRLNFRRDNAGVPQLRLDYPDGSFVNVLNQAGMDFATIYVPLNEQKKIRETEREEVFYRPAFEVTLSPEDGAQVVGYVIAHGEGWNAPYEFVPFDKAVVDEGLNTPVNIDEFTWGQWLENGFFDALGDYERPFEDLDVFLQHKFFCSFENPGFNRKETRTLWEVPPSGTRNRLWECQTSRSYSQQIRNENAWLQVCCPSYAGEEVNGAEAYAMWEQFGNLSASAKFKFSLGAICENGDEPDTPAIVFSGPTPYENVYDFDSENIVFEHSYEKLFTGGHFIVSGDYETPCSEQIAYYESTAQYLVPEAEALMSPSPGTVEDVETIDWSAFFVALPATIFQRIFDASMLMDYNNRKNYLTRYSSAEDANHFGVLYGIYDYSQTRENNLLGMSYCELSFPNPASPAVPYTTELTNFSVKVNISGESFILGNYSEWGTSNPTVRYYRVGDLEFFMGCFRSEPISGPVNDYRWFFLQKNSKDILFNQDVVLSDKIIPGITGPNDETLYHNEQFRLIKIVNKIQETWDEI